MLAYGDKYLVTLYQGSNKVATYARDPQNCLITGSVDIQSGNLLSPNRGTIIKDNLYIVSSMDNAIVHYKLSDDGMLNYQGKNLISQVEPMSFGNLDNNFLYATYRGSHQIEVFKINQVNGSLASIQTIPSGGFGVRHIAFNKAGTVAYATNQFSNQVTIFLVDKASGRMTKKNIINSGGIEPYGISIVD